jgi:hypothetical protein
LSERPPTPERQRMSPAHRRRFQAVYYLILDYHHAKQRAAGQDAPPNQPLTDRVF